MSGKHHWNKTPLLIYTLADCLLLQHQLAGAVLTSALLVCHTQSCNGVARLIHPWEEKLADMSNPSQIYLDGWIFLTEFRGGSITSNPS